VVLIIDAFAGMHGEDELVQKLELSVGRLAPLVGEDQLPTSFPVPALSACLTVSRSESCLESRESGQYWRDQVEPPPPPASPNVFSIGEAVCAGSSSHKFAASRMLSLPRTDLGSRDFQGSDTLATMQFGLCSLLTELSVQH